MPEELAQAEQPKRQSRRHPSDRGQAIALTCLLSALIEEVSRTLPYEKRKPFLDAIAARAQHDVNRFVTGTEGDDMPDVLASATFTLSMALPR